MSFSLGYKDQDPNHDCNPLASTVPRQQCVPFLWATAPVTSIHTIAKTYPSKYIFRSRPKILVSRNLLTYPRYGKHLLIAITARTITRFCRLAWYQRVLPSTPPGTNGTTRASLCFTLRRSFSCPVPCNVKYYLRFRINSFYTMHRLIRPASGGYRTCFFFRRGWYQLLVSLKLLYGFDGSLTKV